MPLRPKYQPLADYLAQLAGDQVTQNEPPAAPVPAPQSATGTIIVLTSRAQRGATVRVEPPDRPWQYAVVVERAEPGGARYLAVVSRVPAGTCWVHLEGAASQNLRSAQVSVVAGGVAELDWRDD